MSETIRLRSLGVAFIVVCLLLLALCVAFYQKAFTPVVKVRFTTDRAGLQLLEHSDVKIRGLIVGEVRSISADGQGAVMELAIQEDKAKHVPSNATGRLLPKTLFGEKYIDLSVPDQPAQPVRDGVVLRQDTSQETIEINKVLDDVLPLLKAVEPAKLNATLNAMAMALEGRGDQLGDTLEQLDGLLGKVNPELKQLLYDFEAFGDVSQVYANATPDLMRALRNINVTSGTIVEKEAAIESLIPAVTAVADKGTRFMFDNGNKIVGVNIASKQVLQLLATYAPSFPCIFDGIEVMAPRADEAFGNNKRPSSNLYIEIVKPRPAYKYPIDLPEAKDYRKPRCYGLPNPEVPFPDYVALDGTEDNVWWKQRGMSEMFVQPGAEMSQEDLVKAVAAPTLKQDASEVPDFATLLLGPLVGGKVVTLK
ncbi:MCE family protein [Actinocorallia sp. A-T 12471]|uniref:MCE family protein n=1 Tax=Actinocorallia sp. A-T 12471 TaxID=3089813 RepID=UPI0029CE4DB9|nr:MCE family protein [Actinocorallia sp. A-T 12471]MDX6738281.1 MCE family protein [Actinocorallia sp. A-T 12471]